jgi:hypothetical protein
MRETDPIVHGLLSAFTGLGLSADVKVQPGGEGTKVDEEAAMFIESCLDDMSAPWKDVLSTIFTFVPFGHAPLEVVYKLRMGNDKSSKKRSKFNDGKIGWRKWALRPQETIDEWDIDEHGGIKGFWQTNDNTTATTNRVYIPIKKTLLFRTSLEKNNPEGKAILEPIYRTWFYKRHYEELEAIGVKRDLCGLPVMSFPDDQQIWAEANREKREEAEELVANIDRDEYEGLVKPEGVIFELMKGAGPRQFDINAIFSRQKLDIAIGTFTEFVVVGHEGQGSMALKRESIRMFLIALQAYHGMIGDVINRFAVPKLIDMNGFKVTGYPEVGFGSVDVPEVKDIAEILKMLADAGAEVLPDTNMTNHLLSLLKLPESQYEEPEVEPEEDEAATPAAQDTKEKKKGEPPEKEDIEGKDTKKVKPEDAKDNTK